MMPIRCEVFEHGNITDASIIQRFDWVSCIEIHGFTQDCMPTTVTFFDVVNDAEHEISIKAERKELVKHGFVIEHDPLRHITIDFWVEAK